MGGEIDLKQAATDLAEREVLDVTSLGGKIQLMNNVQVALTIDLAEKHLKGTKVFAGERPIRDDHVLQLATCMERGTFHCEWVNLITCEMDGETYRMNGQHTAAARLLIDKEWTLDEKNSRVRLLQYKAEDMEAMRQLYASIDRGAARTRAHVSDAYLADTPEFKKIRAPVRKKLPGAIAFWLWETQNDRKKYDADDVTFLMRSQHLELALKVGRFLSKCSPAKLDNKPLYRVSVIAAMFATFNSTQRDATQFWNAVADGVGLEANDPRNLLRTLLLSSTIGGGGGSLKTKLTSEVLYRKCLVAWNAWRENKEFQYLRTPKERPEVV